MEESHSPRFHVFAVVFMNLIAFCFFLSIHQEAYTRVLKGHIALALAVFPNTTQGL